MQKTQLRGVLLLLAVAFIWGSSFVAQSAGTEGGVEPFTFNGIRTLMGAAVLLPFILIRDLMHNRRCGAPAPETRRAANRKLLISGGLLGVILCAASNFQQFAFLDSTAGKISFITAFYMLFVPLFGLVLGKRVRAITWGCVVLGTVGLYFLCIGPNDLSSINRGDLLTLICAVIYAVHILMIEKFAPEVDSIKLSCVQFFVSGTISCVLMFIFETPSASAIGSNIVSILYAGIMSCGFAYTFQIVGQKYTESTVASLLMCMESVFGVLCSAVLLHERLSAHETLGCVIMFAAIILSQVGDQLLDRIKHRRTA
ncbi:MAG: DMT family transporter [Clostridia bacterium]|nr:DMT family transporter [Clostridia bacterium]